jgi:hypothetical protein
VYADYRFDPAFFGAETWAKVGGDQPEMDVLFVWDNPFSPLAVSLFDGRKIRYYETSVLKHAPSVGRQVAPARTYLRREMALLKPKVICPMGMLALKSFVPLARPWHHSRGKIEYTHAGTPVVAVESTQDFQVALQFLEEGGWLPRG